MEVMADEEQVVTVVDTLVAMAPVVGREDRVVPEDRDPGAMAAMVAQVVSEVVLEVRLVMGAVALTEAVEKDFGPKKTPTKEKERVKVRFGEALAEDRQAVAHPVALAAAVVQVGTVTGLDLPVGDRQEAIG